MLTYGLRKLGSKKRFNGGKVPQPSLMRFLEDCSSAVDRFRKLELHAFLAGRVD